MLQWPGEDCKLSMMTNPISNPARLASGWDRPDSSWNRHRSDLNRRRFKVLGLAPTGTETVLVGIAVFPVGTGSVPAGMVAVPTGTAAFPIGTAAGPAGKMPISAGNNTFPPDDLLTG